MSYIIYKVTCIDRAVKYNLLYKNHYFKLR